MSTHDFQQGDISRDLTIEGKLDTFTCFPHLPREVRLQIWREVAHQPRNVDVYIKDAHIESRSRKSMKRLGQLGGNSATYDPLPTYHIMSRSPHPAVLQTCRESLYECRKFFSLEFSVLNYSPSTTNQHTTVISPARIYVQWKVDRLCLINSSVSEVDLVAAVKSVIARAITMKATSIALNIYRHQRRALVAIHLPALVDFAYHTNAKEIIMVWQPHANKCGASIDANGRITWTFVDIATTSKVPYGTPHRCLRDNRHFFLAALQRRYLTKKELSLPRSEQVTRYLKKEVPTKLRLCNFSSEQ